MPISELHPAVWAIGLAFPIIMVVINELVKSREIRYALSNYNLHPQLVFS